MGLCLCAHVFDNDDELSQSQLFARDCAILRSKIQARKMPMIWMLGDEKSISSHSVNIAERFGFSCLDATKISKDESARETNRGKIIKSKIGQGKRVPDRVMVDLIKERMISAGDTRGYILIGFPTTIKQALLFTKEMSPVDCVLLLQHKPVQSSEKETPSLHTISPLSMTFSAPNNSPKTPPGDKERQSQSQPASPQSSSFQHEIHQIQHSLQHLQLDKSSLQSPPSPDSVSMLKGDSKEVKSRKTISERKRQRQREKSLGKNLDRDSEILKEGEVIETEKYREKEEEEIKDIIGSTGAKWDLVMEKINASEAAGNILLKIEAAILDRTQSLNN